MELGVNMPVMGLMVPLPGVLAMMSAELAMAPDGVRTPGDGLLGPDGVRTSGDAMFMSEQGVIMPSLLITLQGSPTSLSDVAPPVGEPVTFLDCGTSLVDSVSPVTTPATIPVETLWPLAEGIRAVALEEEGFWLLARIGRSDAAKLKMK